MNDASGVEFTSGISGARKITPKEIEEYGEELIDVIGRRAQEVCEPQLAALQNEIQILKRQTQQNVEKANAVGNILAEIVALCLGRPAQSSGENQTEESGAVSAISMTYPADRGTKCLISIH